MYLSIRPEVPADIPAIHTLTVAAFLNAPHTDHNEQFIVDVLRADRALSISLVAEEGALWLDMSQYHLFLFRMELTTSLALALSPSALSGKNEALAPVSCGEALRLFEERGAAGCVVLGRPCLLPAFWFQARIRTCSP